MPLDFIRWGEVTGGSAPAFSPAQISGLVAWQRADFGVSLTAGAIDTWASRAPGTIDVTQAIAAQRPPAPVATATLNNQLASNYDLVDDGLFAVMPAITDVTMFAACDVTQIQAAVVSCLDAAAVINTGVSIFFLNTDWYFRRAGGGGDVVIPSALGPAIVGGRFTAAYCDAYLNSVTAVNSAVPIAFPAPQTWCVGLAGVPGFGYDFSGPLAEAILYDRLLTDGEISRVMRYLGARYGVTIT